MKFLVVGGAGYVGGHFVHYAHSLGHKCLVYDNFSRGFLGMVPKGVAVEKADILDTPSFVAALQKHRPDVVLHYAAFALVGESVANPAMYYRNNVAGVISLVEGMLETKHICPVIFSSSCAVFGTPKSLPIKEDDPKEPLSPYGWSKYIAEQVLRDASSTYKIPTVFLRYFNACGADQSGQIGEAHDPETHLIPNVIRAVITGQPMQIFGNDFDTSDGTCVRDYVHVTDLAKAHLSAAEKLYDGRLAGATAINLGSGKGYSNLEILRKVEAVTGKSVPYQFAPRRSGDPPALYADILLAKQLLDFEPEYSSLENIVATAWRWHSLHPKGFR